MSKHTKWLAGELPALLSQGILTQDSADRLRGHYQLDADKNTTGRTLLIFGILGAFLVGLGIILMVAYNWQDLSRFTRTAVAVGLLFGAQVLAGWVMLRRPSSLAWREGVGVFWQLMIGASLALINQTYNIPTNTGQFTLVWMLLSLPVVYLLRAVLPAVIFLGGTLFWATYAWSMPLRAPLLWLFGASIAPFLLMLRRENPRGKRPAFLHLSAAIWLVYCASCAFGEMKYMHHAAPFLAYAGLFSAMYLLGLFLADRGEAGSAAWTTIGLLGVFGTALAAAQIPMDPACHRSMSLAQTIYAYTATIAFPLAALFLLYLRVRRSRTAVWPVGLAPLLAGALLFWERGAGADAARLLLFNLYCLGLAVATIAGGIRGARFGSVNLGLSMFALLVLVRFFDSNVSLLARAAAFILTGLGFLLTNLFLLRRWRGRRVAA